MALVSYVLIYCLIVKGLPWYFCKSTFPFASRWGLHVFHCKIKRIKLNTSQGCELFSYIHLLWQMETEWICFMLSSHMVLKSKFISAVSNNC